jgi:hypothetical protein
MIYELKENNLFKVIFRITLILLGLSTIITAIWINGLVILFGLYLIAMSLIIKDRCIQIFNDRFELKGKSLLSFLNSIEIFCYSKIKKIEFSESYTDIVKSALKSMVIDDLIFICNPRFGSYSKPDTITIVFTDDTFRVINKLGSKNQFMKCFQFILEQIQKQKNAQSHNNV